MQCSSRSTLESPLGRCYGARFSGLSSTIRLIPGRESKMSLRKITSKDLLFSAVFLTFVPLLPAEAQDVVVPNNITMHDSTDPTVGNILKEGVPFLHNFGVDNTFIGKN